MKFRHMIAMIINIMENEKMIAKASRNCVYFLAKVIL